MNDNDVWRAAHIVMRNHGEDATFVAAMRAEELLMGGDPIGCSRWIKISRAIHELRLHPADHDALH